MSQEHFICKLYEINLSTKTLSLDLIKKVINTLQLRGKEDPEAAHCLEDDLYKKFITAVANETVPKDQIVELAKELDKLSDIKFSRWYA